MAKLAFIGNSEPPGKLLEMWRKQTPGRSGVWGKLEGTDDLKKADYYMVIDLLPPGLGVDPMKCVFLGAHPPSVKHIYQDMSRLKCLAKADARHSVGFLEWWINYDYDYLKALQPPTKTKLLGAVMSDADTMSYHKLRKIWMRRFCQRDGLDFNLHGRIKPDAGMAKYYRGACGSWDPRGAAASGGNDHMSGKEQFYIDHKYVIEFDAEASGTPYFSERILDSMLLWAMPLYWGGELGRTLPPESFRYINIHGDASDVMSVVNSDFYEQHIADLTEARRRLLDESQLWPRTHKMIFGTCQ